MKKKITLKINNKKVIAVAGQTILEVAKENNIFIPTLCHHPDLPVKGNCRICLVEIKGQKRLFTSCSTVVKQGMEVKTNSKKVKFSRNLNLELIFSEHVEKCPTCINNIDCQLLALAKRYKIKITEFPDRKNQRKTYKLGPAVEIDGSQCIDCQSCLQACELLSGISHLKLSGRGYRQEIKPVNKLKGKSAKEAGFACVYCGQCALHCPVGSAQEQSNFLEVEKILNNPKIKAVAQIAPAVRVSIGEEFGLKPGEVVTEKLFSALKLLGFEAVFDVNFGADITTLVEAQELVDRIKNKKPLPMMTSCCPAWVRYIEVYRPELIPLLTSSRSPQLHNAGLIKSYWQKLNQETGRQIKTVSIMPCTAKKYEAKRPELKVKGQNLIDEVLTTRELAYLLHKKGIDLKKLKPEKPDNLLSRHSGAAAIYGGSGGVMESALRTAKYYLSPKSKFKALEFKTVRGLQGIKEANFKIGAKTLKVAVVSGLKNAQKLLDQRKKYHYIEVMACPGGCIGGGGQPIPTNSEIREKRRQALYKIDATKKLRQAHKNNEALNMLKWLEDNNLSHKILHTKYFKRTK
ncbi:MAG: [FeFe] hydrogenase, group A [Candidatus Pacebacteria bacterium]|nr:[FeFe] hydrogenase, group A [Candidatus Paceibacterota bacterium]